MSPGDQLISVIVNSVGTLISALIGAFFSSFIGPLFDAIASLVGLGGGA
jgi:hypothetical protein